MIVFDVAQELYDSKEQRDSLFHALREQGKEPVFSDEGDFCGLHDVT